MSKWQGVLICLRKSIPPSTPIESGACTVVPSNFYLPTLSAGTSDLALSSNLSCQGSADCICNRYSGTDRLSDQFHCSFRSNFRLGCRFSRIIALLWPSCPRATFNRQSPRQESVPILRKASRKKLRQRRNFFGPGPKTSPLAEVFQRDPTLI